MKKSGVIKHTRNIGNAKLYQLNIENSFVQKLVQLFDEAIMPKEKIVV